MDLHCEMLLEQFHDLYPSLLKLQEIVDGLVREKISENGIYITAVESRVKAENSLAGKLELKGQKYSKITDITDLMGMRVIAFYNDEVDKIAAIVSHLFDIDWENSVDKRKIYDTDRFGYMSLHYICRLPKDVYYDEEHPEINEIRFEIQMRTALQHVWATVCHDIGYKSDIEIPREYMRRLSCMAGLLELADREFLSFRSEIEEFRRKVRGLIRDGRFDDINLDKDSYTDYMAIEPFKALNERIASVNHAEIQEVSAAPYLEVMRAIGLKTLGDVERMRIELADDAYNLAKYRIGTTELDIVASTIGIMTLCFVYVMKNGGRENELVAVNEILYGKRERNIISAKQLIKQAQKLNIIQP